MDEYTKPDALHRATEDARRLKDKVQGMWLYKSPALRDPRLHRELHQLLDELHHAGIDSEIDANCNLCQIKGPTALPKLTVEDHLETRIVYRCFADGVNLAGTRSHFKTEQAARRLYEKLARQAQIGERVSLWRVYETKHGYRWIPDVDHPESRLIAETKARAAA